MSKSLITAARDGYAGRESSRDPASRAAVAWAIGVWLNQTGRTSPRSLTSEKGGLYAVNDMLVRVRRESGVFTVTREA